MTSNDKFYNRMKEMAGIKPVNESKNETNTKTLIDIERSNNGTAYGIVKENHYYFIKKSLKEGDVSVTDFIYIDGVANKSKYQYNSLSEAEKQRNFYVRGINEAFDQGGVYFVNESKEKEAPSLNVNEDFNSFLKKTINSGKQNIVESREKKFKSTLPEKNLEKTPTPRRGLMPESADIAVKKALGLIKEEVMVTADSEIKDADKVSEKKGKESAQAPINDTNAKSLADKATGSNAGAGSMSNNVDNSPESNPFDDKEDAGDETGDIVTENEKKSDPFDGKTKNGSKNVSTADSDQSDADRVDNKTKHEKEQAPYNNHNQPEKGHKEQKGVELKPVASKKDIVAESEEDEAANALAELTESGDLSTADSEIKAGINDKNNIGFSDPKLKQGTSKKMNDNAIAEGEKEDMDGDGDIDSVDYLAKKDHAIEKAMKNENDDKLSEAGEEEIDSAASDINKLDGATDAEEAPTPDMSGEEAPTPDMSGEEAPTPDGEEMPADGGEEIPADGGGEEMPVDGGEAENSDLVVKEIEKLVGKTTEKIRTTTLEPEVASGFLKSIISSFEDKLPEMDLDDRKEVSDNVLKPEQDSFSDSGEEEAPAEEPTPDMGGEEEASNDAEVDGGEFAEVEEDAPMMVNGEKVMNNQIPDGDGGTFESYMESRGYSKDNLGECSASEMGSIVSGYVSDKDDLDESEIESIASYMNDDVVNELEEYGLGEFAAKAKPHMKEGGVSFGTVEPTLSADFDMDDDMDDFMDSDAKAQAMADIDADGGLSEEAPEMEEPEIGFSGGADIMGAGVVKPQGAKTKSVEVDLNAGTLKMDVSEGNEKVRKYIQNRIQELAGKKKPSMNESSKSENLKELDKLIEAQWKQFGGADIMGGGVFKPQGVKTKSLNAGTLKMDVSEGNEKVRKYIQNRIQELAGKKKPSMNESSKSENLKELDKLIEAQWKQFGENLLK